MIEMSVDSIRVSVMNSQRVVILKENKVERYLPIWIGPTEADAIAIRLQGVSVPRPLTHDLLRNTILALESASGASISSIVVNDLRNDTFYAKIVFELADGRLTQVKLYPDSTRHRAYTEEQKLSFTWRGKEHTATRMSEWQEPDKRFFEVVDENGVLFELCHDETIDQWLITKMKIDSRPSDAIALAVRVKVPIYAEEEVLDKAGIVFDQETGKPIPSAQATRLGEKREISEEELRKLSAFSDFINTLDLQDLDKDKPEDK